MDGGVDITEDIWSLIGGNSNSEISAQWNVLFLYNLFVCMHVEWISFTATFGHSQNSLSSSRLLFAGSFLWRVGDREITVFLSSFFPVFWHSGHVKPGATLFWSVGWFNCAPGGCLACSRRCSAYPRSQLSASFWLSFPLSCSCHRFKNSQYPSSTHSTARGPFPNRFPF